MHNSIPGRATVMTRQQIFEALTRHMPKARNADIAPFVEMACGGKASVEVDELLLNCFVNTPLSVIVLEKDDNADFR